MNDFPMVEIPCRIQEALDRAVDAFKPFESGPVEAHLKSGKKLVTKADPALLEDWQPARPQAASPGLHDTQPGGGGRTQ